MIEWERITHGRIESVRCLVARFHVSFPRAPDDLEVEVWDHSSKDRNPALRFVGVCNYEYWGPDQATPYRASRGGPTIEDAFNDAMKGIESYYRDGHPDNVVRWVKRVAGADVIVDGAGKRITE